MLSQSGGESQATPGVQTRHWNHKDRQWLVNSEQVLVNSWLNEEKRTENKNLLIYWYYHTMSIYHSECSGIITPCLEQQ